MKHRIIYIFLFVILGLNIQAQDNVSPKTLVETRIPSKEKIEEYRKNKHFQYEESKPTEYPSWLSRFFEWLNKLFSKSSKDTTSKNIEKDFFTTVFAILLIALIIAIILRTQKISLKSLFGRQKIESDETIFYTEDVDKMEFDNLIADAIKSKNYRLAIRFLYLKNLKALSDRSIIDWNPNKTNYSYQNEIENIALRSQFLKSTYIFDFVWYGEFILDERSFDEAHTRFKEFNQMISNER